MEKSGAMTIVNSAPDPNAANNNANANVRTPTPTVAPALLFPGFPAARRHSDSHQILARPTISVSLAEDDEDPSCSPSLGANRRRANSYSPLTSQSLTGNNNVEEVVCSTGELLNLRCLSKSALEMRNLTQGNSGPEFGGAANARRGSLFYSAGNNNYANHQRSRSFDASVVKKSPGGKPSLFTGLLNRFKGAPSPTAAPPIAAEGISGCSTSHDNAPPSTPVQTVLVLDPASGSGPTITTLSPTPAATPNASPSSQDKSPAGETGNNGKTKKGGIPWDNKPGYFLDAALLGLAIENHLKKDGNRRRATFSTLSDTSSQLLLGQAAVSAEGASLNPQNSARPRSASAFSVLPFEHRAGEGPTDPETISRRRESIASAFPPSGHFGGNQGRRNSSFTSSSCGGGEGDFVYHHPAEDVIVGSFIKTSMTSELYSEDEVILEEEQGDFDNFNSDNGNQHHKETKAASSSSSSFLSGMGFWRPKETIINIFTGPPAATSNRRDEGDEEEGRRFSCGYNRRINSVDTINEEEEEPLTGGGTGGRSLRGEGGRGNTFCGFIRKLVLQFIHNLFRS